MTSNTMVIMQWSVVIQGFYTHNAVIMIFCLEKILFDLFVKMWACFSSIQYTVILLTYYPKGILILTRCCSPIILNGQCITF